MATETVTFDPAELASLQDSRRAAAEELVTAERRQQAVAHTSDQARRDAAGHNVNALRADLADLDARIDALVRAEEIEKEESRRRVAEWQVSERQHAQARYEAACTALDAAIAKLGLAALVAELIDAGRNVDNVRRQIGDPSIEQQAHARVFARMRVLDAAADAGMGEIKAAWVKSHA